jgi:hypothetical protein
MGRDRDHGSYPKNAPTDCYGDGTALTGDPLQECCRSKSKKKIGAR